MIVIDYFDDKGRFVKVEFRRSEYSGYAVGYVRSYLGEREAWVRQGIEMELEKKILNEARSSGQRVQDFIRGKIVKWGDW